MATPVKKYTVRKGTIDYGKQYEIQMAALLSLRCVLSVEEDMWLASNPDGVGDLDDVVINVKRPEGISLTYMLQLKHKETPKPISEKEFLPPRTESKVGKEGEEDKNGEEDKKGKEDEEEKTSKDGKMDKEGEEYKKGEEDKKSEEDKNGKEDEEGNEEEEGKTSKDGKEGKHSTKGKEGERSEDVKTNQEGKEGKTNKEREEGKTSKDVKKGNTRKKGKGAKDSKKGEKDKTSQEGKEDKKGKEGKKSKEAGEGEAVKTNKEGKEGKTNKEGEEGKTSKDVKKSKTRKKGKEGKKGEEGKTDQEDKEDEKKKESKKSNEAGEGEEDKTNQEGKKGEEGKTSQKGKEGKKSKKGKEGKKDAEGKTSQEGKKGKKGKEAFSLIKYFRDIDSLKKSMQSTTKNEDLIKELGKFNHIYFVLFTNRPTENCAFLKPVDNNHANNLSFINTSDSNESNAYVFDTKQLTESSISKAYEYIKFYLLTNQVDATCIDKKIAQELARIVAKLGLTQVNLKEVFEKYLKFMTNWAKGYLGPPISPFYSLTLKDVLWKLTALLLSQYELNLKESPFQDYADERNSIWNEIIRGKSIIFVDSTKIINDFLIRHLTNEVVPYCKALVKSWADPFNPKDTNWFYKTHTDLEIEMFKIVGQSTITPLDLHKCLWKTRSCPLLLEISKEEDYKNVMSILNLFKPQPQIVIIKKMMNFFPRTDIDQFSSLQDLDKEQLEKILSLTVKIQGRAGAILNDLLDKAMFSHITTRDVIDILSNQFNIGTELISLPPYFINRSTVKVFLKAKILEEVTDEIFLLTTHSREHEYRAAEEVNLTNLKMGGVFTIQEVNDDLMKSLASLKQTIHCLSVFDESLLEWKWSFGTTRNIRPFRVFVDVFEDNIEQHSRNAVNIISEVPGMGKSVLMDFIALKAPPNQWVLKIDLNSHHRYFRNLQHSKPSASKHLQYFCETFFPLDKRNAKLNRLIFQKLAMEKNMLILLDGFDEVSVWFKDEVTDMAKCFQREGFKLWFTTRPHMKYHLEEEFDTFAISLKPFTIHDQTQFLIKYFSKETPRSEINPKQFVERLLQTTRNNLQDRDAALTGVALQTRLLADFFIDKWKQFSENGVAVNFNEKFDLLKLYRCFIDKKLDTLTHPKMINDQKLFALQLVFSSEKFSEIDIITELDKYYTKYPTETENLQRNGIMMINERGDLSCIHQTFAEYLAAEWMWKNFNSNDSQIKVLSLSLIKERSTSRHNFLFNIFDRLVAQNCPLHMAILNENFGEAKNIINSRSNEVFVTDEFKRTALHIATNYNKTGYEFGFISDIFKEDTLDVIKKLPDRREFYSNPDILGYTPLDYALENDVSSIVVEAVYNKINYSVISARLSIVDEQKYLMRCYKLKHILFDTLLPYYISRKLLLLCVQGHPGRSYMEKNTRISKYLKDVNVSTSINMTALEYLQSGKAQLYSGFSNNCYSDIRFALVFGGRENVDQLLAEGAEVNKQDVDGNTALHYAAAVGDLNIVKTLLAKGALGHIRNITFRTPLDVAEAKQNFPILNALISSMLNTNLTYRGRKSLLHYVAEYGSCQDVNKVLKTSDINKLDDSNATPLRLALVGGKMDVAKLLLTNGADVSVEDKIGRNAFHDVITYRCEDVIPAFPNNAAAVNKQDINGDTPLHLASAEGLAYHSPYALLALLSKGANVNLQNAKGETPIHLAAKHGKFVAKPFFRVLLNDAQVNTQDKRGETALHAALHQTSGVSYIWDSTDKEVARKIAEESPFHIFRNIWVPYLLSLEYESVNECAGEVGNDIIKLLIDQGIDVNISNAEGDTALHLGIRKGNVMSVRKILSKYELININEQDTNGNTYLHLALKEFRLEIISSLIATGIDLNIQNNRGQTALHITANRDYYVAYLLLFFGANIDKQDIYGNTALHLALYDSYMLTAELLVAAEASIDIKNKSGDTALHCACRNGYSEIFDKPMCRNVDLNVQNNDGDTPLHIAVSLAQLKPEEYFFTPDNFDCEGIVRKLLYRNIDINIQNASGETALHTAIRKEQLDIAALLLGHKPDVNLQDKEGRAALYYAISGDHEELAVEIVLKGAEINMQDNVGNTPLHLACMEERTDIASFLISRDADVNLKNSDGRTVFHYASEGVFNKLTSKFISEKKALNRKDMDGNTLLNLALSNRYIEAAKMLLETKVDVKVRNDRDWTSLHYASRNGYDELVADILIRGANVDRRNNEDNSSLHLAVVEGHVDVVKLLISKGARVDIVNSPFGEGHTPLHLAVIDNNIDIIRILLDKGANAAKLTKFGKNVLHYVKDYKVAVALISKGADVNAVDQHGNTPLLMVAGNDPNLAKLFLDKGASTDVQDKNGNTPLILASRTGILSTVTELILQGADVNAQNRSGETALMVALKETRLAVALMVLAFGANTNLKNSQQQTALSIAINSVLRVGSLHFNNKNRDWKKGGISKYQANLKQWMSVVNYLADYDKDLNAQDSEGNTPLHYASMKYDLLEFDTLDLPEFGEDYEENYDAFHKGIAAILLSKGVDLTIKNKKGLTALDLSRFNNTDVTALLLQHGNSDLEEESDSDFLI